MSKKIKGVLNFKEAIRLALKEDSAIRDITTESLVAKTVRIKTVIICRQNAVICGLDVARQAFKTIDKHLKIRSRFKDGASVKVNASVMSIAGSARSILAAERVALNFLSHLSGIATETGEFVKKVRPYKVKIMDTRKTTPGLRGLQKYAVSCGGGSNHRFGLQDMILIKDNHKRIFESNASISKENLSNMISKARRKNRTKKVEIEVENLKEFKEVLLGRPDIIMLDNMPIDKIKKAVRLSKGRKILIEASGNISLKNVRSVAKTGVDIISIGKITHSAPAVDFSLEVCTS